MWLVAFWLPTGILIATLLNGGWIGFVVGYGIAGQFGMFFGYLRKMKQIDTKRLANSNIPNVKRET